MGLLDDAIRQHLELKRAHGASSEELAEKEAEAFGPVRRERLAPEADDEVAAAEVLEEEPLLEEGPLLEEPPSFEPVADEPTELLEPEPAEPEPFLEPVDEPEPLLEPEPELRAAEAAAGARESDLLEPLPEPPLAPEAEPPEAAPRRGDTPTHGVPAVEADPADEIFADEPPEPAPEEEKDEEEEDEDVLEETPDFLQETPEHDRLWFEQKPPRDFDFDDD